MDGGVPDGGDLDGGFDGGDDGGFDAGPVITGELFLVETKVLNPGMSATFFGQGLEAQLSFRSSAQIPAPFMEESPGSPFGCKGWILSPAEDAAWRIGIAEGTLQFTATGTSAPAIPSCTFASGSGYWCPHLATQSTGGTIAAGPAPGTFTLTDPDVTYNAANTSGRHVLIQGATNAANNGLHALVALGGANTILGANPAFVAETLPNSALHVNVAAAGAIPSVPDPGFLNDDVSLTLALTTGGAGDVMAFSATTGSGTVGDMPTLATAELNRLNNTPTDGSQFSITCDLTGCPAGSANATVLEIVTTDAAVAGLSPFAMPSPLTTAVRVRCVAIGQTSVTVPAAYSALLQGNGATRLQATFSRITLMGGGPSGISVGAGQGIRGFRTP